MFNVVEISLLHLPEKKRKKYLLVMLWLTGSIDKAKPGLDSVGNIFSCPLFFPGCSIHKESSPRLYDFGSRMGGHKPSHSLTKYAMR